VAGKIERAAAHRAALREKIEDEDEKGRNPLQSDYDQEKA
jgi:hypothetical protein